MSTTLKVSIRIVLLFTLTMALSFIPEYCHTLFGDWLCKGSGVVIGHEYLTPVYSLCNYSVGIYEYHDPTWHWGYRHWLWQLMGLSLALVQIVNIIIIINTEDK